MNKKKILLIILICSVVTLIIYCIYRSTREEKIMVFITPQRILPQLFRILTLVWKKIMASGAGVRKTLTMEELQREYLKAGIIMKRGSDISWFGELIFMVRVKLEELGFVNRDEAVSFLKKLWSREQTECPICGNNLELLHKKAKKKECDWQCSKCNKTYKTIQLLDEINEQIPNWQFWFCIKNNIIFIKNKKSYKKKEEKVWRLSC